MNNWKSKKIAILGWGINGLDSAKYLLKNGAELTIFDRKTKKELDFSGFDIRKARLVLGRNYLKHGLGSFDCIFRTPAVYRYLPEIVEAESKGVFVTSAIKVFFDDCQARIIGVTGTKGKGTTSTLIYEILKKDGRSVYLAGNIGLPVLELLPKLKPSDWVVLELSSFQLIDLTKSPHISVVLNITEDHLDWHKDKEEYIKAKSQIVRHQAKEDFCVLAFDYKVSKSFSRLTNAKVFYFSTKKKVKGAYVKNGKIFINFSGRSMEIGDTQDLLLRGKHNWENICAAACAAYLAGVHPLTIRKVLFSFKGLEHRLELVAEVKGVSFYNDSFSTNPQTTIAALRSFEEPLTLILGGSDKGLNYDLLGKEISKAKNIANVILIGQIAKKIKRSIKRANFRGNLLELGYPKMQELIQKSFEITPKGGVVLLSPAAASFDMFKDYKDRGYQFKEAVRSLTF